MVPKERGGRAARQRKPKEGRSRIGLIGMGKSEGRGSSARARRKKKALVAVAARKSRPPDVCTICHDATLGPALRAADRRLGRYMPCGCSKTCWTCAYNHAMRSSLWDDDNRPIQNEDDLKRRVVRCPCCNSAADAFEECGPSGAVLVSSALPFDDLTDSDRFTLRREPPSAWGVPRDEPVELSPDDRAEVAEAERAARRSSEQQAKHGTAMYEAEFREGVACKIVNTGLQTALARTPQVWPEPEPRSPARPHARTHALSQVWALAHVLAAGREGAVAPHHLATVGERPVLGRDFNPAVQLVDVREGGQEGTAGAAGRRPRRPVAAPALAKNGCTVRPPSRVTGRTTGLFECPGGRVISRCAAWPVPEERDEFIAYICHRLVQEGAAVAGIAPRCKHKVSPALLSELEG